MKVYLVWFTNTCGEEDLIDLFLEEDKAKAFVKSRSTYGNEGLHTEEKEVTT